MTRLVGYCYPNHFRKGREKGWETICVWGGSRVGYRAGAGRGSQLLFELETG
jgi:hypothetical protein